MPDGGGDSDALGESGACGVGAFVDGLRGAMQPQRQVLLNISYEYRFITYHLISSRCNNDVRKIHVVVVRKQEVRSQNCGCNVTQLSLNWLHFEKPSGWLSKWIGKLQYSGTMITRLIQDHLKRSDNTGEYFVTGKMSSTWHWAWKTIDEAEVHTI